MEMQREWPFFKATLDSIEMVFSKSNPNISAIYDDRLVDEALKPFGQTLRSKYHETVENITGYYATYPSRLKMNRWYGVRLMCEIPMWFPLNLLQVGITLPCPVRNPMKQF